MPNWCVNYLTFQGKEEDLKQVENLFDLMILNEDQKPEFIEKTEEGYFYDIYKSDFESYQYETKWSPNVADVLKIAEHFNLSFVLEYEELDNDVFGKTFYDAETKKLTVRDLNHTDFSEIEFDLDRDIYSFRGAENESDREFLEELYKERYNEAY